MSGIGVISAIGQGREAFTAALLGGVQQYGYLERAGRALEGQDPFVGAEIDPLEWPVRADTRALRTASFSAQVAAATLADAWEDARLDDVDPLRIGLLVGGSNLQQRELVGLHRDYAGREQYVRPSYAASFLDTDLCGLLTEMFGIRGFSYTIGAASASGQVVAIQAAEAVMAGKVDVCIALGALMDLSFWELQALRSTGAMGSERYAHAPSLACRPFDRCSDGFIYGEACAALVIESPASAARRGVDSYGSLCGSAMVSDASRGTQPSADGEVAAARTALHAAGLRPADVDYVNPHGTGAPLGDQTELRALRDCGLVHARINATKSVTGHSLTAAGAVEIAATLLQMRASMLHPTLNLDEPIDSDFGWVGAQAQSHRIGHALCMSMGFGGINTAVCLRHPELV